MASDFGSGSAIAASVNSRGSDARTEMCRAPMTPAPITAMRALAMPISPLMLRISAHRCPGVKDRLLWSLQRIPFSRGWWRPLFIWANTYMIVNGKFCGVKTMDASGWDREVDLLVIGSGAGGMTAALVAANEGLSV